MSWSVAMTEEIEARLRAHLLRSDGQEDLCFALWRPSHGATRTTALIFDVLEPIEGDRLVHGNAGFMPAFVERAMQAAIDQDCGIAFLHAHPLGRGWQGMSRDDVAAERGLAPTVQGASGLPLVGLTLAGRDGGWSARAWSRVAPRTYERQWCETVRVVGDRLRVHFNEDLRPTPHHKPSQARTRDAWGPDAQAHVARLDVGIVGLGSVGSIVAEALARTGVKRVSLLDFQSIEDVNLDRTLHATQADVDTRMAKVAVAARAMQESATSDGFEVRSSEFSICEEEGFRLALDCDVLFCCVDRPWPRSVLNHLAYAHLIPVIDGGIHARQTSLGRLYGADWKAHVVGPTYRCMLCLGQYDPGHVGVEKNGDLDDPTYIASLDREHPLRASENVLGFSLGAASLEVLQFLLLSVGPLGAGSPGSQNYHFVTGKIDVDSRGCDPDCIFPERVATGEQFHSGTDDHPAAVRERNTRMA